MKVHVRVGNSIFQITICEKLGVDNIFSLKLDYKLPREDKLNDEGWSDASTNDFYELNDNWGGIQVEEIVDENVEPSLDLYQTPKNFATKVALPFSEQIEVGETVPVSMEEVANEVCQTSKRLSAKKFIKEDVGGSP
ncbi:hypothetical protein SLA2020_162720 [Shorea laevis]